MTIDDIKKLLASQPKDDDLANAGRRHLEDLEFIITQLNPKAPKTKEKRNG